MSHPVPRPPVMVARHLGAPLRRSSRSGEQTTRHSAFEAVEYPAQAPIYHHQNGKPFFSFPKRARLVVAERLSTRLRGSQEARS